MNKIPTSCFEQLEARTYGTTRFCQRRISVKRSPRTQRHLTGRKGWGNHAEGSTPPPPPFPLPADVIRLVVRDRLARVLTLLDCFRTSRMKKMRGTSAIHIGNTKVVTILKVPTCPRPTVGEITAPVEAVSFSILFRGCPVEPRTLFPFLLLQQPCLVYIRL